MCDSVYLRIYDLGIFRGVALGMALGMTPRGGGGTENDGTAWLGRG